MIYHKDDLVTLHHGDVVMTIPEVDRFNVIITSPPYNLDMPYKNSDDAMPFLTFRKWTYEWLTLLHMKSQDDGRLILNVPLDTNKGGKQPVYGHYISAAMMCGWHYQTTIVWNEQNISRRTAWGSWMSASAPFVTAPVEMIVVFYKHQWGRKPGLKRSTISREDFMNWTLGMWTFPGENPKRIGHPAPFPEELPRRLIEMYSYNDDVIFDPFCGSGTTNRVAKNLGRRSIGIDNSSEYLDIAIRRCVSDTNS